MRIDNKEFLNPQQQLYQNTKDIEKLKADYQPVYSYEGLIGSTTIHTVNRSSTNVPAGVNIGWLMDYTGKLFKITDGSSTTLLIDYYAQIKGPKGDTGNTGPQGPEGPQGPQGEPGQTTIGIEVVAELPATGEEGVIYFVPKQDSETGDEYEEYTYVNNDWELLGGATVDLTNYALKSELPVIDEDLIPKAFNTYVLGDNTHSYKEVVANKFKSPNSYYEMSGVNVSGHGAVIIKTTDGNGTDEGKLQLNNIALYCNKNIAPLSGSTVNLGQAANGFNNLYLDGKIVSDDNLSYGLALPDTTSFTADKTIATTDQIPTLPNYNITDVITDNSEVLGMQIYNTSAGISYNIHNTTANPTLAGTESNLTSIDIGGTAYAIPSGGGGKQLYQHNIFMQNSVDKKLTCQITIINDSNVAFNYTSLKTWLFDKGFVYENSTHKWYNAKGHYTSGTIMGIDYVENSNTIFALQLNADFSSQTEGSISSVNLNVVDTIIPL